jgi:hypothetical protein
VTAIDTPFTRQAAWTERQSMDENVFRTLLVDHMMPMLAGIELGETKPSSPRHKLVAFEHPCALLMKPSRDANYRIQLTRSQAFTSEEKRLVAFFVDEVSRITAQVDAAHFPDLMSAIPRRVISQLLPRRTGRGTLEQAIREFDALASQTYEGHPIVAALGMTGSVGHGAVNLEELFREDFSRVISNGFDSMYLCGSDGRVFNVGYLPASSSVQFAPHRLGSIAEWCCRNQRVAIVLNRSGEILVFKDRKLQFAKRRGAWRYYAHDSVVKRLGVGNASLRRAVYESCLDVSFGRAGGCVAVLTKTGRVKVHRVIENKDLITNEEQTRTELLNHTIRRNFQQLDRRMRQELLSMDGATILTRTGEVLTAGSIVRVPSGSTGGGRRAAALALSRYGLAIKISADGPITGFRKRKTIFTL